MMAAILLSLRSVSAICRARRGTCPADSGDACGRAGPLVIDIDDPCPGDPAEFLAQRPSLRGSRWRLQERCDNVMTRSVTELLESGIQVCMYRVRT